MISVMQAAQEGRKIEYRHNDQLSNGWKPCPQPSWNWIHFEYRVKPEPQLRPYVNAKEFLAAMKEHGPYVYRNGFYSIVGIIDDNGVKVDNAHIPYIHLLSLDYQWQDGTPIGVVE